LGHSIQRELMWPKVVRETIPKLVGEEVGIALQAVEFISDGAQQVQITLQGPPVQSVGSSGEGGARRFIKTYKLNLNDGAVHGTKVCVWERGRGILDAGGLALLDDMEMKRNVDWADRVAEIPAVCNNMRYVRARTWAIYDEDSGLWVEHEVIAIS
jgi:hypothetical protein